MYINIILKTASMSDQLQMFEEQNSQESTLSLLEVLAKTLVWLEKEKEWMVKDQVLSLKQLGLSKNANQIFLSGKMLKELSPQTLAQTLQQSSKRLLTLGVIDLNGNCLIQSGFYPVGCLGKGSGRQVFPITENNRTINELQGQQANTCTLTTRYEAGGNGSYIIERKLNAQKVMKVVIAAKPTQLGQSKKTYAYKNGTIIGKKNQDAFTIRSANPNGVLVESKIRRLTPIECERLQGFEDDWTKTGEELGTISDSQRYKMCGNAVTVDVVEAVANKIKNAL
jgi:site-specific DNA-cytosine methylase